MKTIINPAGGETIKVLKEASETNNKYTKVAVHAPAHTDGPPTHFHHSYDEEMLVLEGTMYAKEKGKTFTLKAGERYNFQKGITHKWWTENEEVRFEMITRPALEGFHEGANILQNLKPYGLLNTKGIPKSPWHLAAVSSIMETQLRGVLTPLALILEYLATTKKGEAVKQEIKAKYGFWS